MLKKIRVGSRESALAVLQSEIIINIIKENCPEYETELMTMKTMGDKILDKPLYKFGGKGLFVKELDRALIEGEVDITVHSLKDMPVFIDERIPIAAYSKRENPYDVLILPKGKTEIDFSKPVGSSSIRRILQLKKLFPEIQTAPVRGNVITRLEKLDRGEYSALILAYAGVKRLGLEKRINRIFSESEIVPAGGQGIIAVQARKDDDYDFLKYINDKASEICGMAERAFLKELDGGCSSPAAAFSKLCGEKINITGFYCEKDVFIKKNITANKDDGEKAGITLAKMIRKHGIIQ